MVSKVLGFIRMKIERRARWDKLWKPVDWLLQKIEAVYWRGRGYTIIECFGDSHVKVFRRLNFMFPALKYRFRTVSVRGATAYSLNKLDSSTGARRIFDQRLKTMHSNHQILLMFGEIDAGHLIWLISKEQKLKIEDVLNKTILNYRSYIVHLLGMKRKVIVCSAPLPTIADDDEIPEYMHQRKEIDVSQADRTLLTLRLNEMMQAECMSLEVEYLNLDAFSLDETTRLCKKELVNEKQLDHHYDEINYTHLIHMQWVAQQRDIQGAHCG